MRLFYCSVCRTCEEIPELGYELPEGEADPIVMDLQLRHYERGQREHGVGTGVESLPFRIAVVDDEAWRSDPAGVIKQLNASNKEVGLDAWVYEATSTYKDDAGKCYNQHGRPKAGCIDYRDKSKLIGHPTDLGRLAARENFKLDEAQSPAICDFCVVKTWVQTNVNWKKGLYKK